MKDAFIDTHCHLDFLKSPDVEIFNAKKAGVQFFFVPSVDISNFEKVKKIAHRNKGVFYSLGIHPYNVEKSKKEDITKLENIVKDSLNDSKFLSIGEIGLDFFISGYDQNKMKYFFCEQLKIASKFNLPIITHSRKSHDLLTKLINQKKINKGIVHAFNGSEVQAKKLVDHGMLLGFGGTLTYERANKIKRLIKSAPDHSFVLETDSPDMNPVWLAKGEQNTPSNIIGIAKSVANLRETNIDVIRRISFENVARVFSRFDNKL